MSVIAFSPAIGPVTLAVFLDEQHTSNMQITQHPVEDGSTIQDHAVIKPKELKITFMNDQAADTYRALLEFQHSRVPFTIVTGLRQYENMLVSSFQVKRDKRTSRVLSGTAMIQEIIRSESSAVRLTRIRTGQKLKSTDDRTKEQVQLGENREEPVESEAMRESIAHRLGREIGGE